MSVPVRRQTHGKSRRRRSHHGLGNPTITDCPKCQKPIQPHHACESCGYYDKKQVINTARDAERALKKAQAKTALETAQKEEAKAESAAQVEEGKTKKKSK